MSKFLHVLLSVIVGAFVGLAFSFAFAQGTVSGPVDPLAPLSNADAFSELVTLISTVKGATALGIAAIVVQSCMIALRTPLADKLGKYKMTALLGLSVGAALLALKIAGASWGAALASGPLLAAAQNFIHQLYTQFTETTASAAAKT